MVIFGMPLPKNIGRASQSYFWFVPNLTLCKLSCWGEACESPCLVQSAATTASDTRKTTTMALSLARTVGMKWARLRTEGKSRSVGLKRPRL